MTRQGDAGRPRVAVVDDEQDVLTFLRLALEDQGFEVLASDRPLAALEQLRGFAPDLICLDLLMPEQMGSSLFLEIRSDPRLAEVPVVILTGLNARDALARVSGPGSKVRPPERYLEKPVDLAGFLRAVTELAGPATRPRR